MGRTVLQGAGIDLAKYSPEYVSAALETCKGKLRIFNELPAYAGFYFTDELTFNPEGAAKQFVPENRPRLAAVRDAFATAPAFDAAAIESALKSTAAALGVKVGVLVHPTRMAVTGSPSGPSLYHLLEVLGREKSLARIDAVLARPELNP
jgi:glutamyl/glutaminyl-tRNA synthetase